MIPQDGILVKERKRQRGFPSFRKNLRRDACMEFISEALCKKNSSPGTLSFKYVLFSRQWASVP
jgi:hypothetical protein